MYFELFGLERTPEFDLQLTAACREHVHVGRIEAVIATPAALGTVERQVGIAQHRVGIERIDLDRLDADACADLDMVASNLERLRQLVDDAAAELFDGVVRRHMLNEDREFVATKTRDDVVVAHQ